MKKYRHILKTAVIFLWSALVFSLVDIAQMAIENRASVNAETIYEIMIIYVVTAIVLSLVSIMLYGIFYRWAKKAGFYTVFFSLSVTGFLYLLGVVHIYFYWERPYRIFSSTGLLINAGYGLFILALFYVLLKAMPAVFNRRRLSLLLFSGVPLLLVAAIFVMALPGESSVRLVKTSADERDTRMNLLFILIDALRADHLSCYGYERKTSPYMDRIAEEGILFTRFYSQAPWTKPSVASIFTSLYPSQHNTNFLNERINDRALTLPEHLKGAGYTCLGFSANEHVSPQFGFAQGTDYWYNIIESKRFRLSSYLYQLYNKISPDLLDLLTLLFEQEIMENTKNYDKTINRKILQRASDEIKRPYFMYVHYITPHYPYDDAPEPFSSTFRKEESDLLVTKYPPRSKYVFWKGTPLGEDELRSIIASYDAEILYMDHLINELISGLEERGMMKNTLLVITSDHGEEFYDHGNWAHGQSLYKELIHVPLIIQLPDRVNSKKIIEEQVEAVDLFPTLSELMGISPPGQVMGASRAELILGEKTDKNLNFVFSENITRNYINRSLISGKWKYIHSRYFELRKEELYDISRDPGEKQNMMMGEGEKAQNLKLTMEELLDRIKRSTLKKTATAISKNSRRELKILGYIN